MKNFLHRNEAAWLILTAIVLFVIATLYIYKWNSENIRSKNICTEFSETYWSEEPSKRLYMYEDLIQKYDFYAMNKEDILQLLGYEHCDIWDDGSIIYYMGFKPGDWFSYNLLFRFGENDKVEEFELYPD